MACTVAQRNAVRRAANACDDHAAVIATDVLAPDVEPMDAWALEIVIEGATVPPAVLRELALADLALRAAPTRGDPPHTVATATI